MSQVDDISKNDTQGQNTIDKGKPTNDSTPSRESMLSSSNSIEKTVENRINDITNYTVLQAYYIADQCVRAGINALYKANPDAKAPEPDNSGFIPDIVEIPFWVYKNKKQEALNVCANCFRKQLTKTTQSKSDWYTGAEIGPTEDIVFDSSPFDQRLYRLMVSKDNYALLQKPLSITQADTATSGYIVAEEDIRNSNIANKDKVIEASRKALAQMQKDPKNIGIPALINTYALLKLYGSNGGEYIVNQIGQRKWYEVNSDPDGKALVPTTSNIIQWGNGDAYGRTPYHFSDFILCKWWKRIPNNRMITLRRYPAPIVDNLKFQGMDGDTDGGKDVAGEINNNSSSKKIMLPPMATAITYFGDGTDNTLSSILKFSTGYDWDDVKSDVWKIEGQQSPDAASGAGGLNPGLTKFAQMLGIASGEANTQAMMNKGQAPPDPYGNGGPYENRILGPVNRIDSVKKRKAGIKFTMSGINLKFHYVARPVGGINPKAVLLDIMSNFLLIGSASAMFFGGQHRFMGAPAQYPFIGGDAGMKSWYSGDTGGWAKASLTSFADQGKAAGGNFLETVKNFFGSILGGSSSGGSSNMGDFLSKGLMGNAIKSYAASKSNGQIPYLQGMRALLTGEPVGEWHVTIGNPLNPIAMIGNLICTSMEVEFGNELGPDDFPTELKITVNLDHGMPRDRDAVQSMFNRGMGRIYDIPDYMTGSADAQTKVDDGTQKTGTGSFGYSSTPIATSRTNLGATDRARIKPSANAGSVSVWNTLQMKSISGDESVISNDTFLNRSRFAQMNWVAQKTLT